MNKTDEELKEKPMVKMLQCDISTHYAVKLLALEEGISMPEMVKRVVESYKDAK